VFEGMRLQVGDALARARQATRCIRRRHVLSASLSAVTSAKTRGDESVSMWPRDN
jgi:hypothetical protein